MMFCPKCGRMNDDEQETCKGCGALLHEENQEKEEKHTSKKKLVIGVTIAALLILGTGAFALTSCQAEMLQSAIMYF